MATELHPHGVAVVSITPGFLRSESMLEGFGVTEKNWRDGGKKDKNFLESESPLYIGRAVAALAADPKILKRTGQLFSSWELAREYKFTDADGRRPDWGRLKIDFSGMPPDFLAVLSHRRQVDTRMAGQGDSTLEELWEAAAEGGACGERRVQRSRRPRGYADTVIPSTMDAEQSHDAIF